MHRVGAQPALIKVNPSNTLGTLLACSLDLQEHPIAIAVFAMFSDAVVGRVRTVRADVGRVVGREGWLALRDDRCSMMVNGDSGSAIPGILQFRRAIHSRADKTERNADCGCYSTARAQRYINGDQSCTVKVGLISVMMDGHWTALRLLPAGSTGTVRVL